MKRKFLPSRDRCVCFSFLVWLALLAIRPCFGSALVNLSLRANVGTGDNVAITGLIIQGNGSKEVVIRGLGPSIPIAGRLANPFLSIYNANGAVIAQNDNWRSTQQALIAGAGLGPANDLESAVYLNLVAGNYSAILTGVSQTAGIGLIEMYDLDGGSPSSFINLSGRANVGVGNNVAITGIVITGSGTRPVVIRGLGKSLVPPLALTQVLADPYLTLYNSSNQAIKTNNDWAETQQFQISSSGLAPSYTKEAAIYAALAPGTYTAALSGVANGTGIGSIEVYAVAAQPPPPPPPTPTPTPVPQRLVFQDTTLHGDYIGIPEGQGGTFIMQELTKTGVLVPRSAGNITIHYTAEGYGTCRLGCPGGVNPPPNTSLRFRITDQAGNLLTTEISGGTLQKTSTTFTTSTGIPNVPFVVHVVLYSSEHYPEPDYVILSYYDVYAP
jgi:hypothetical protein